MHEVPIDFNFSDIIIPSEISELCADIRKYTPYIGNNTFILDANIYYNAILDILYYYKMGLINDDEFSHIRLDLSGLIDRCQKLVLKGCNETNARYDFYLSSLPIEANSSFTWFDDSVESYFYSSHANPMGINNKEACLIHKKWLNSLKKYSSLITQSNEVLQSSFFKKQREYIDNMMVCNNK